jgi:serine/threonine-protein kinase
LKDASIARDRMQARDGTPHRIELGAGARVGAYAVDSVRARLPHVVIYRAEHVVTGRTAALYVLRPTPEAPSLGAVRREVASLHRLRHPNVAEMLEHGELEDGRPYLVVEWVAGRSLETMLAGGRRLGVDDALAIAEEIAAGLAAAHALGVVHGELYARNVGLVVRGGHQTIKLVNFGMARVSGTRVAPEQATGDGTALDKRVDVFAFGALLYQMVTGVVPLADPPPPSALVEVPFAFDEVVLRALRKDPARRWDGVEPMMAALRAGVDGSELTLELHVTAELDPALEVMDKAAAVADAERAVAMAKRGLEEQKVGLVLAAEGVVIATAKVPRALEQQRAARAAWVKVARAVQQRLDGRAGRHPGVRTRVQIRIDS